jgi:hypothetical protein
MLYRLMRDWRGYRAGKIFEPPPSVASILVRRLIAEPVEATVAPEKTDKPRSRRK